MQPAKPDPRTGVLATLIIVAPIVAGVFGLGLAIFGFLTDRDWMVITGYILAAPLIIFGTLVIIGGIGLGVYTAVRGSPLTHQGGKTFRRK